MNQIMVTFDAGYLFTNVSVREKNDIISNDY